MAKLVRDLIPEIIQSSGRDPIISYVTGNELIQKLKEKLLEESQEVFDAPADKVAEEVADVLEVIEALMTNLKISEQDLEKTKQEKLMTRGGFSNGIILH